MRQPMRSTRSAPRWWKNLAASRWDAAGAKSESSHHDMISERIITVFGSSRTNEGETDCAEARGLGAELARAGFSVCTGGYGGVMEAASRGAKEAGGRTYGVTAEFFKPQANAWVDVEVRMKTWQERLFELI